MTCFWFHRMSYKTRELCCNFSFKVFIVVIFLFTNFFANLLLLYRALPHSLPYFMVIFAFANGPVAWATCIFRNSLVFHVVDKMTSVYIHVLPLFVTYGYVKTDLLCVILNSATSKSSWLSHWYRVFKVCFWVYIWVLWTYIYNYDGVSCRHEM